MNIAERINKRARELGLTQVQIAKKTGKTKGAVNQWFKGATKPNGSNLLSLAKALKTSAEWLENGWLDKEHSQSISIKKETIPSYPIPILNTVQAGSFTEINQDTDLEYDLVTPDLKDCFALKVIGDSMQPTLIENMIAYIRPQESANNGDIVIAQMNNDTEATVKRFRKDAGTVYLMPDNDKYDVIKITEAQTCRIIGIVVSAKINF